MKKPFFRKEDTRLVVILTIVILGCTGLSVHYWRKIKDRFGEGSRGARSSAALLLYDPTLSKYRIEEDKQYLWAGGPLDPDQSESDWFDLTDSPLPLDKFQYGIGRDRIRSIDKPVFVKPDDPRLAAFWSGRGVGKIDDLRVIGYTNGGVARAYPVKLLDRHELVNDRVGGKPVTVGW